MEDSHLPAQPAEPDNPQFQLNFVHIIAFLFLFFYLTWKPLWEKLIFWGRKDILDQNLETIDYDDDITNLEDIFPFLGKSTDQALTIIYGTQTGTAKDLAGIFAQNALRYHFKVRIIQACDYDHDQFLSDERLVVFLLSTYGEGDPCDDSVEFFKWISSGSLGSTRLTSVEYAVFGLGDSSYTYFNQVAKVFDKGLEQSGAKRVFPTCLGDAAIGLEDFFLSWNTKILQHFVKKFNITLTPEELRGHAPPQKYTFDTRGTIHPRSINYYDYLPDIIASKGIIDPSENSFFTVINPFHATVVSHKELHSSKSDRSCKDIQFKLSDPSDLVLSSHLEYAPGDHLAVLPVNQQEWVLRAAKHLGLDTTTQPKSSTSDESKTQYSLQTSFHIVPADENNPLVSVPHIPSPTNFKAALTYLLDIEAVPTKQCLRVLAEYAEKDSEKQKLLKLCSFSSDTLHSQFYSYITDGGRNLWDVLEDFPSIKIPQDRLFDLIPPLKPRYYSISSSPNWKPGHVSITSVLVSYKSKGTKRQRYGVCTQYLSKLKCGDKVRIFIRKSNFRLPPSLSTPIIMIGPGTGVAPFRGFIQERIFLSQQKTETTPSTSTAISPSSNPSPKDPIKSCQNVLFFGCRKPNVDFLYKDELEQAVASDSLQLFTAFSRMKFKKKVYVQDKVKEAANLVYNILTTQSGHLYICGDAGKMSKDVFKTVRTIFQEKRSWSESQAQQFLEELLHSKRFQQDVW